MVLTIDAGNTKTKWALFDASGNICHQDACLNAEITTAKLLPDTLDCNQIVISNVAGAQHAEQLQQRISLYTATITWVTASKQAAEVVNNYATPASLGTDRWAALIAAWHLHHATCVVVNAGTATTIDAIIHREDAGRSYGEFIGGMILPGIELMQTSLGAATAQLPKTVALADQKTVITPLANNTSDAIYSGAIHATLGAITQMLQAVEQQNQTPKLIISGGNASAIQQALTQQDSTYSAIEHNKKTVTIVDNLVLQGLYLLAQPAIHTTS
jgi:type III pantothenate kinase